MPSASTLPFPNNLADDATSTGLSPSFPTAIGYPDHKVGLVGWSRQNQELKSQLLTLPTEWEINSEGLTWGKRFWGQALHLHDLTSRTHSCPSWQMRNQVSVREALQVSTGGRARGPPSSGPPGFQPGPECTSPAKSAHFSEAQAGRGPTPTPGLRSPRRLTVNVPGDQFLICSVGLRSPQRRVVRINEPELRARPSRARRLLTVRALRSRRDSSGRRGVPAAGPARRRPLPAGRPGRGRPTAAAGSPGRRSGGGR